MNDDPVLRIDDLVYRYREGEAEREVLRGVSFSLGAGERVALIGDSGSGKSTLLNLIGTIDSPDAGRIRIAGTEVAGLGEPARTLFRRAQLGFVYQRFNLLPMLTVAENIALPLELLGVDATEAHRRVEQWLQAVGLAPRRDSFPDRLSGGEQQRVAIARALVHGPRLLLADEPTGSLDPRIAETVLELLFDRGADGERALLLVTHSEAVAGRADRVLRLVDGQLHGGDAAP